MYTLRKTSSMFATHIPTDIIENGEDWEEIVPTVYEIVSVKAKVGDIFEYHEKTERWYCGKDYITDAKEAITKYPTSYSIKSDSLHFIISHISVPQIVSCLRTHSAL